MAIQYRHGNGFAAQVWKRGEQDRGFIRRYLRRLYSEGTQCAFRYYEDRSIYVAELQRLTRFMNELD
jgi:hypothetical protein